MTTFGISFMGVAGLLLPSSLAETSGGEPLALGMLLQSYNPEWDDGKGWAVWTSDPAQAMHFANSGAALKCWRSLAQCHPVRETDGRPNRPLTAVTVEIAPL